MLSLRRVLKLRDLEIFHVWKQEHFLSYVIIEDTRNHLQMMIKNKSRYVIWKMKILMRY